MTAEALEMYEECTAYHLKLTKMIVKLESKMIASGSIEDQADAAFAARECAKAMEHCAKQLRRLEYLTTQVCCALWASTPGGQRIKTEYCSAFPSVEYKAAVPSFSNSKDRYAAAMRGLGVPEPVIESGCLTFHWKRLCEYVTRLVESNQPLPAGINIHDSAPKFTLNARSTGKLGRPQSDALSPEESEPSEVFDAHGDDSPF